MGRLPTTECTYLPTYIQFIVAPPCPRRALLWLLHHRCNLLLLCTE